MYGAIFGDIIGSRFEFDRGGWTKEFTLFTGEDSFTDDTVMTVAIAEALQQAGKDASAEEIRSACIRSMQDWGRRYPGAGYGSRFFGWLFDRKDPKPYGSFGNGSAMRVSAAGWLYDSLERTLAAARATAEVTHNHPEGIKGAECTAGVMYLARTGAGKEEIEEFITQNYGYDVSASLEELRARHAHVETCQDSMPKALTAFLRGSSYEDVVRNAVSLGGDTDTLAAIAGAMVEAMYGIPLAILAKGIPFVPPEMQQVISGFEKALAGKPAEEPDPYAANACIREAAQACAESSSLQNMYDLLSALADRMGDGGEVPAPMVDVNRVMDSLDLDRLTAGGSFTLGTDMRLQFDTMVDGGGTQWIPLFTGDGEVSKGQTANIIIKAPIESILSSGLTSERAAGVVIDPFSIGLVMPKKLLKVLMEQWEPRPWEQKRDK